MLYSSLLAEWSYPFSYLLSNLSFLIYDMWMVISTLMDNNIYSMTQIGKPETSNEIGEAVSSG